MSNAAGAAQKGLAKAAPMPGGAGGEGACQKEATKEVTQRSAKVPWLCWGDREGT